MKINGLLICLSIFFSFFSVFSCREKSTENNTFISLNKENNNFDSVLKCVEYTYSENYFFTADYGCICGMIKENNFGNITIYLIPKKQNLHKAFDELDIKNIDIKEIKDDFEIFLFLIPKEYLNYNTNGDPSYYQNEKYKEDLYTFVNNNWLLIDDFKVKLPDDEAKLIIWREDIIKSKVSEFLQPNHKSDYNNENKENKLLEYEFDFNQDNILDKIVLYENKFSDNQFNKEHFGLPIKIFRGTTNGLVLWVENNDLIQSDKLNCIAEGFDQIVSKNNYFTLEENICSDNISIMTYKTFKIVDNVILLHKYGETYFDKADHDRIIPEKIWTTKDFGKAKFEELTESFFIDLRQKEPK